MPGPISRRASRFWLFLPFVLIAIAGVAWSAFWFTVRNRTEAAFDGALVREAQAGRAWRCLDRTIGGFPFRIELRCAGVTLESMRWGAPLRVETGALVVLGQLHDPLHVLAQMTSPMRLRLPDGRSGELRWDRLEASGRAGAFRPERASIALAMPSLTLGGPALADETWAADSLEGHLRGNPTRPESEEVSDLALSARRARVPLLDAWLGGADAADLDLQASVTRSFAFLTGFNPDALEAWRVGDGQLELKSLSIARGQAKLDAAGTLRLDEARRPAGRIEASAAGIDRIAGIGLGGVAAGLGALLGGRAPTTPGLTPLPPLELRDGRIFLGPFRLPLQPLAPLY